ncbi:DpnII family type II restriction endonuclease [Crocosphaera watsonii]|uniref:DpnII family type II restriction endonuclease n=1 Tax=Crocosphaera watsonii TaxID=263511 RepID=UPI0022836A0F|nr:MULTISPECIES: DpnII family type II restriction endonuclease [Crocosphaera]
MTGGATANTLGQVAQKTVIEFLKNDLGEDYEIKSNAKVKLEGYENDEGIPFDIVVQKNDNILGIEVSFQVTTNSTIERKAAQAETRQNVMHKNGYKIAYIIDGAGNFARSSAITKICQYSDCTIAYKQREFQLLGNFIRDVLI